MFVENGPIGNHILAIINEKGNLKNKTTNESNFKNTVKLPVIELKIRKELYKAGCKVFSTPATSLKSISCNDKSKLLPSSYPDVYQFGCNCGGHYIGETKNVCLHDPYSAKKAAWQENGNYQMPQNAKKSCHRQFDWLHLG